jgi:hypothetical protein
MSKMFYSNVPGHQRGPHHQAHLLLYSPGSWPPTREGTCIGLSCLPAINAQDKSLQTICMEGIKSNLLISNNAFITIF